MNPTFEISANLPDKKLEAAGMISVGEKIDLLVHGLPENATPRFRIVTDMGKDLAVFPLAETDEWTKDGDVYKAKADLNTDRLRCHFSGVPFKGYLKLGIIVDSAYDDILYARGDAKVYQWPLPCSEDPVAIPNWKDTSDKIISGIADFNTAKQAIDALVQTASTASSSAASNAQNSYDYKIQAEMAKSDVEAAESRVEDKLQQIANLAENAETSNQYAQEASAKAVNTVMKYPRVASNGNWEVWNVSSEAWKDSGVKATGPVGDNGIGFDYKLEPVKDDTGSILGYEFNFYKIDKDGNRTLRNSRSIWNGANAMWGGSSQTTDHHGRTGTRITFLTKDSELGHVGYKQNSITVWNGKDGVNSNPSADTLPMKADGTDNTPVSEVLAEKRQNFGAGETLEFTGAKVYEFNSSIGWKVQSAAIPKDGERIPCKVLSASAESGINVDEITNAVITDWYGGYVVYGSIRGYPERDIAYFSYADKELPVLLPMEDTIKLNIAPSVMEKIEKAGNPFDIGFGLKREKQIDHYKISWGSSTSVEVPRLPESETDKVEASNITDQDLNNPPPGTVYTAYVTKTEEGFYTLYARRSDWAEDGYVPYIFGGTAETVYSATANDVLSVNDTEVATREYVDGLPTYVAGHGIKIFDKIKRMEGSISYDGLNIPYNGTSLPQAIDYIIRNRWMPGSSNLTRGLTAAEFGVATGTWYGETISSRVAFVALDGAIHRANIQFYLMLQLEDGIQIVIPFLESQFPGVFGGEITSETEKAIKVNAPTTLSPFTDRDVSMDNIIDKINDIIYSLITCLLVVFLPFAAMGQTAGGDTPALTASAGGSAVRMGSIRGDTMMYTADAVDALTDPLWNYMLDKSFRVTVTNYDSVVHAPMAYFEYRLTPDEPWRTVWSETNALWGAVQTATNLAHQAAQAPAEKAWGQYDSLTGQRVPEGVVQVQAEGGMVIGGGMGWSAVEGTQYWVLTSTDPTLCATGAEGRFEIKDADGKSAIQVIKGDKKLVPARAESITAQGAGMVTINYSVVAASAPVLEVASELAGPWYTQGASDCPADVTWTGESGAWVATADCHGAPKMFFKATYETGGDSYVNIASEGGLGLTKVRIGTKTYTVAVEDVNGKKLMVLNEVQ